MDLDARIADLAAPAAQAAGLVVDSVTIKPAGKRTSVVVTVDLPADQVGSADIDAIAQASRDIGAALDDANVPSTPYTLEVSTPGIDRPLTERHHFSRARTRLVTLTGAEGATTTGRLTEVTDEGVVLTEVAGADEPVAFPWDVVEHGAIEIEWKKG